MVSLWPRKRHMAHISPYFPTIREMRARCASRCASNGAPFSMCISAVDLRHDSLKGARRGGAVVQQPPYTCEGHFSQIQHLVCAYRRKRFCVDSQSRGLPPWPRREQEPCPERVACPRKNTAPHPSLVAPRNCGVPTASSRLIFCLVNEPELHAQWVPPGDAPPRPGRPVNARPVFFSDLSVRHGISP
jgi:hypothetical protein